MKISIEQKPRLIFSPTLFERTGEGWIVFYFEGPCIHATWQQAIDCLTNYYAASYMIEAEPPTTRIM
jgi:hypothetical protein